MANLAVFLIFLLLKHWHENYFPAKTLKKLTTEIFIPLKLKHWHTNTHLFKVGISARIANGICKMTNCYHNFLMLIFYLRGCNLGIVSSSVPSTAVASQRLKPGFKTLLYITSVDKTSLLTSGQ